MIARPTVAPVVEGLGVASSTANGAVLAEGKRVLVDDPDRFNGVAVVRFDEHVCRHTRPGYRYVTVVIDLTPIRNEPGPPGCSAWSRAARSMLRSAGNAS